MLRLLTMCIPFRNLRKKGRAFLRDFLSDYDRNARRSMRAWRRHAVAGRTILILEPNYCHGEVLPGFCRHLLDMGYRVDVLMHHSLAGQSPLCCFKENEIQIFTAMCTSWKRLAKAPVLNRYEAILVSTSAFYDTPGWAGFLHMTGLDRFTNLLAVEHELNDIPRFGEEGLERQGRLLTLGSFPKGTMVNPHFFGEIPPAPRNREPVFITVGSLSAQRKNHNLLIEALQTIYHEGHRDFSVIIVGEGELGEIPGHLRPFLHVAGKLDFPAMYEAMRRADYFLPLLDPGNPAHDRYITTGITGSALLIYGFAKIPVIHEKFASFYGFNDRNALLYGEETLGGAMLRAIRQTEEEYAEMQQALLQLGRDIDRESRSNLTSGEDTLYVSRAIARCRSVALTSEKLYHYGLGGPQSVSSRNRKAETRPASYYAIFEMLTREKLREGVLGSNRTAYMNYIVPLLFPDNEMPAGRLRHWAELWREAGITSEHICGIPREQRAYLEAALAGQWIYLRLLQCFWKFKTARRHMFRLRFSKNGIDTIQILGRTLYSAKKLPRSSL